MFLRSAILCPGLAAALALCAQNERTDLMQQLPNGQFQFSVERTIPLEFLGEIEPFIRWDASKRFRDEPVRDEHGLIGENEEAEEEIEGRRGHPVMDPNAQPQGVDPAWQRAEPLHGFDRAVDLSVTGMGYTSVSPADPCLAVGPNHVIQMINGSSGAYFRIFDKNLANPGTQTYMDNFVNAIGSITTYSGAGDPIVLYDAMADRWVMTEFSASGNRMIIAVSTTASPTGSWYAYSVTAPSFPDYPKYGVWSDCYVITTNETSPAIYALPRANMLAGTAGTVVRFTISSLASIGFQAATPVHFGGGTAPPAGAPAMFMRMVDDLWTAAADVDRLELWNINYNVGTPGSSTITGPTAINTTAFDTHLCGYTTLNCINQPGAQTMDPLREVLMNRICYRNLDALGYEALVCAHAVDLNTTDRACPRWYELHRTGGSANPWSIYQEGTYSPDANDRWMPTIAINANGDIGLAYNIAGTTGGNVYPSIRYTGRYRTDPLGQMTFAETSIVAGSASHNNNRYGDYSSLDVDPSDGTSFYGTAMFNPAANWSTRMFKFSFPALEIKVSPKLFLEGPYEQANGTMHDSLRTKNLIPATEPFTAMGYTFAGGGGETVAPSVLTTTGNNAIVDWVVVELRNPSAPATILASKSALVQRDGDVVSTDGVNPVAFNLSADNYHVAVRHRNHLGTMTNAAVALSASTTTVNFTTAATSVYGTNARKDVAGVQVLWAGDVSFDHALKYTGNNNDRDPILVRIGGLVPTNTATGYYPEDVNMTGVVKYTGSENDRDPILVNIGGVVPTNTVLEQLP